MTVLENGNCEESILSQKAQNEDIDNYTALRTLNTVLRKASNDPEAVTS